MITSFPVFLCTWWWWGLLENNNMNCCMVQRRTMPQLAESLYSSLVLAFILAFIIVNERPMRSTTTFPFRFSFFFFFFLLLSFQFSMQMGFYRFSFSGLTWTNNPKVWRNIPCFKLHIMVNATIQFLDLGNCSFVISPQFASKNVAFDFSMHYST